MWSFEHIAYLLLLILSPVLLLIFLLSIAKKKKVARSIGDIRLVKIITAEHSHRRYVLKFSLLLFAFLTGVIALANLRTLDKGQKVLRNGIDVMIALDVSNSMLAQDISPSRLERAKQIIGKVIDKLTNDRIGIVLFAGKAYLQMPLTSDHGAAALYLSSASPELVPTQGTVIGDALRMCNLSFSEKGTKYKTIILFSDGEDHDENALTEAETMAKQGVVINTIGIASAEGSTIPDPVTGEPKKDNQGNIVYSRLNEAELSSIAQKGNGIFKLFTTTDEVVSGIMAEVNTMDRRTVVDDSLNNYTYYFQVFVFLFLCLLIAELFIPEVKTRKRKKIKLVLTAFMLFPTLAAYSQDENELVLKGNNAYKQKQYSKAADYYEKAAKLEGSTTTPVYNLGNALYKNGKKDEALQVYDNVLKRSKLQLEHSAVLYNKGVVYQNSDKLDECIDAYKKALIINPGDEDARQNLQKALRQKKPREQQEQKNQDQKNKQQNQQQSRLSNKEAEDKLKALMQQEKKIQEKMKKANAGAVEKPEKDW